MRRGPRTQPGYVAALLHRLSGTALAIFVPFHFIALATVLNGADALDSFLSLTDDPFVKLSEAGLVGTLALHMALGLRVLAIEFLGVRERTGAAISACIGAGFVLGLSFLLNGP
jgi:fumarate reductase subunit D